MANNLGHNPWILDTANTSTVLWPGRISITNIVFYDYTVETHVALIQNADGITVWKANGASDLRSLDSGPIGIATGLIMHTLDSGKVAVYIE